jgi:chromosome partitioning protein
MGSKIISIVNQKGGVGKTTTAINLATYLAKLNQRVLLIDLDPQANATSGIGVNHQTVAASLYEVFSGSHSLEQVSISLLPEGLKIAPANQNLAGANIELVSHPEREFCLYKAIEEIKPFYDYIIIDSPPSLGLLTINGLVASESILIPVQCEYFALEGLGQLLNTINLVKQYLKPDLAVLGAVMTMYDDRHKLTRDVFEELYRYFPHKIFRTVIPRHAKLAEAPSFGQSIFHYDPQGKGARAYEKLAREFIHNTKSN